jgi:hypothetical protein
LRQFDMNRQFLTLSFCWLSVLSQGQSFISAKVIEEGTLRAISYASISLTESIGTASDGDGRFRMPIEANFARGKINISCLGYYTRHLDVDSLLNSGSGEHMIYLKPFTYQLNEITIPGKKSTAKEIVQEAIKSIPSNYNQQPFNLEYYSKISTRDSIKLLHLVETVSKAYREGYKENAENFAEIREKREEGVNSFPSHDKTRDLEYFRYEILPMFDLFLVDMIGVGQKFKYTVFNPDYLVQLEFRQKEITRVDSDTVMVIEYDKKDFRKGPDEGKLYGALYISINNLAIVKHVRRIGKNYLEVIYKKQGEHYYPYFIKTIYPERSVKGVFTLFITHEAYVKKITVDNIEKVKRNHDVNKNWHMEDVPYHKEFWDKYYPKK